MTDHEQWQQELDAAAARSLESEPAPPVLSEIDLEVRSLCTQFSEADLLAAQAQEDKSDVNPQTPRTPLSFKREVGANETVAEAYQQLVGIAEELREELAGRKWDQSVDFIDTHISHVRTAYNSGQLAGLASSVAKGLGRMKTGCELFATRAVKMPGTQTADIGELFLLTALSAHELRRALNEVYDC
jgi:hypothetical protein